METGDGDPLAVRGVIERGDDRQPRIGRRVFHVVLRHGVGRGVVGGSLLDPLLDQVDLHW